MNIYNLLKNEISQKELLDYYNANITYISLPIHISGFVFCYKNIFNIFINKHLSYYKRKKIILHEIAHIELEQFCQNNNDLFAFKVDNYEDEADKYIKSILEKL